MAESVRNNIKDKNAPGSPENDRRIVKLLKCWTDKIIGFLANYVSIRATISASLDTGAPASTDPGSAQAKQQQNIGVTTVVDNTAVGSDITLFGNADVGRDINNDWHVCSYTGCGWCNIISEYDIGHPPVCQNSVKEIHMFKPSQGEGSKGGDDNCSEKF